MSSSAGSLFFSNACMIMFEDWVHETYTKAFGAVGINAPLIPPGGPAINAPSRPDQPASDVPPVPDCARPFCGVKVPCIGDQLTRVRFTKAKDLRAGCHTSKDRLDHLCPFPCAAWHTKRSFLKVRSETIYYDRLYECIEVLVEL